MRKLIDEAERHRRLKEQIFGRSELLARNIEKLRISEATLGLSTTMATAIEKARIAQGLPRIDRQWEIAAERVRELATFGALGSSAMAEAMKELRRPLLDEPTRKALAQAATSLSARFRLPDLTELQKVGERMKEALAPFAAMHMKLDEVQRSLSAIGAIRTPWIDRLNAARSFDSFAGLVTLATAARFAPYAPGTIETVRNSLGTWTNVPKEVEQHSVQCEEFYQEHGLNTNLIAIPEPAFTQSLEVTGVVSIELLVPDADDVEFDIEQQEFATEEHALIRRISRASQLVYIFEVKLREFIHQVMTQHCGEGWEKSRTPENGNVCEVGRKAPQRCKEWRKSTRPHPLRGLYRLRKAHQAQRQLEENLLRRVSGRGRRNGFIQAVGNYARHCHAFRASHQRRPADDWY